MKPSPKCDDSDAIAPPARCARVPPVAGSASGLTRVGSCELQRLSNRSITVCASARFQSIRTSATLLSVARSPGSAGTVMGTPVAPASARKRAAESGLTPRSEEHTSELQSRLHLVCRLLLEKKKNKQMTKQTPL